MFARNFSCLSSSQSYPLPNKYVYHFIESAASDDRCKVGKLNTYRKAPPEQLAELHPADRLMVQLIEIDRLGPRVEGMLYKTAFEESWTMLDEVRVSKITQSSHAHAETLRVPGGFQKPARPSRMRSISKNF